MTGIKDESKSCKAKLAKKKQICKVAVPYTAPNWPLVQNSQRETILALLVELLSPIGLHRKTYIVPSKGRRSKKRKRQSTNPETPPTTPAPPHIIQHLTIGFNSTVRALESTIANPPAASPTAETPEPQQTSPPRPLSAIFLTHPPTSLQYAGLPTLAAHADAASARHAAGTPPTLLVPLSGGAERRLCEALGIPRLGVLGVRGAGPGAGPLLAYVRAHVGEVELPFLGESARAVWMGTRIVGEDGKEVA